MEPWPPALLLLERERKEERKREKFYIYSDVTHTHTCSEISYRITDVECIIRAKNTSVNLTGTVWMIRGEKLCEGKLSTSLLEGSVGSDAAQADCENRTVVWFEKHFEQRHAGSGLSRLPFREMIN